MKRSEDREPVPGAWDQRGEVLWLEVERPFQLSRGSPVRRLRRLQRRQERLSTAQRKPMAKMPFRRFSDHLRMGPSPRATKSVKMTPCAIHVRSIWHSVTLFALFSFQNQ